ncbi:MAG TPA: hydrogen gas-evolving membrane-bound hydrogenase subunit E [Phycisphaerae bacterium]|nr:hydrogen gas-evolving membrane-bound hydrogenase subunit E [Phycisphaerae bacterium]
MDPVLLLLLGLLGFMLIGSLIAVETRDLLSSVICVGAVGFGTSLVFLLLGAPDLALTQVVVEILVLVVLVRVIITRRDESYATSRATLSVGLVLLALGVMAAVVFCMLTADQDEPLRLRPFGDPLLNERADAAIMAPAGQPELATTQTEPRSIGGAYLEHGVTPPPEGDAAAAVPDGRKGPEPPNAANYVMAILLDYRAYDTMGEATVIFVAILGVYAVLRKVGRERHAGNESDR